MTLLSKFSSSRVIFFTVRVYSRTISSASRFVSTVVNSAPTGGSLFHPRILTGVENEASFIATPAVVSKIRTGDHASSATTKLPLRTVTLLMISVADIPFFESSLYSITTPDPGSVDSPVCS